MTEFYISKGNTARVRSELLKEFGMEIDYVQGRTWRVRRGIKENE